MSQVDKNMKPESIFDKISSTVISACAVKTHKEVNIFLIVYSKACHYISIFQIAPRSEHLNTSIFSNAELKMFLFLGN